MPISSRTREGASSRAMRGPWPRCPQVGVCFPRKVRSRPAKQWWRSAPGPGDVFRPLGYEIPLAVKRGYHMHYGVKGNAGLGHPVRDADGGFALAPMIKGVRLTTGVEFADRDAPPSPVQLARDEPLVDDIDPPTARSVRWTPIMRQ